VPIAGTTRFQPNMVRPATIGRAAPGTFITELARRPADQAAAEALRYVEESLAASLWELSAPDGGGA
jgi:hypothetical protein